MNEPQILNFPQPPVFTKRSWWRSLRWTVRESFYRLLQRLHVPGAIQDMRFHDVVSGQELEIRVGIFQTRMTINGRDYYFCRISGKLDGTGSGCLGEHVS